ncbi:MAG: flagellar hook basal-body protein [Verrucomicrobia bacterium]|nr:flagellar hook basal-body protein [Verrucomicrobiota bacterium]
MERTAGLIASAALVATSGSLGLSLQARGAVGSQQGDANLRPIIQTGVASELAVQGPGYFILRDPTSKEVFATRCGSFRVDSEGYLISIHGFRLQGFTFPIPLGRAYADTDPIGDLRLTKGTLPAGLPRDAQSAGISNISFDAEGRINILLSDGSQYVRGQVLLQDFRRPYALKRRWLYLFSGFQDAGPLETPGRPSASGLGALVSGALDAATPEARGYFPDPLVDQVGERTEIWAVRASELTVVQASTDLIHWRPIRTNTYGSYSIRFVDPEATGAQVRFYRTVSPVIKQTGRALDLALSGQGYFIVRNAKTGSQFATRNGSFWKDDQDYMVTSGGLRLQGYNTPVVTDEQYGQRSLIGDLRINKGDVPPNLWTTAKTAGIANMSIDGAGRIYCLLSDGSQYIRGQVVLQNFTNPFALVKEAEDLFSWTVAAGPLPKPAKPLTQGLSRIDSGALEMRP